MQEPKPMHFVLFLEKTAAYDRRAGIYHVGEQKKNEKEKKRRRRKEKNWASRFFSVRCRRCCRCCLRMLLSAAAARNRRCDRRKWRTRERERRRRRRRKKSYFIKNGIEPQLPSCVIRRSISLLYKSAGQMRMFERWSGVADDEKRGRTFAMKSSPCQSTTSIVWRRTDPDRWDRKTFIDWLPRLERRARAHFSLFSFSLFSSFRFAFV